MATPRREAHRSENVRDAATRARRRTARPEASPAPAHEPERAAPLTGGVKPRILSIDGGGIRGVIALALTRPGAVFDGVSDTVDYQIRQLLPTSRTDTRALEEIAARLH